MPGCTEVGTCVACAGGDDVVYRTAVATERDGCADAGPAGGAAPMAGAPPVDGAAAAADVVGMLIGEEGTPLR